MSTSDWNTFDTLGHVFKGGNALLLQPRRFFENDLFKAIIN